jgi:CheY-like chemotaxis protein
MARILVVDDSNMDLRIAGALLAKEPEWSVCYARNGIEALDAIEAELPNLVVTDMQMPEMNGLELVERIRDEYPLIPVILMTAAGSESIAVEALQKGASSYVPKRELAADLVDTAVRLLAASSERRTRRRLLNYLTQVNYSLKNDLELLSALTAELREIAHDLRLLDESQCLRFATAVDEALTNAYFHGNLDVGSEVRERDADAYHALARERQEQSPYQDRKIHVTATFSREAVTVHVRDEGAGFDPASLPDPTSPGFLERPCGRGVLLMRAFMDNVQFNDKGNEVTMVKNACA